MMNSSFGERERAWMRQWRSASVELEKVKRAELADMTDEDAREAMSWLLDDTLGQYKKTIDPLESGLVIQQRYFRKSQALGGKKT